MAVWHILWSFGILFSFWYVWTKKNLATLILTQPKMGVLETLKRCFVVDRRLIWLQVSVFLFQLGEKFVRCIQRPVVNTMRLPLGLNFVP
jgi:hypothetical protein